LERKIKKYGVFIKKRGENERELRDISKDKRYRDMKERGD
jgi:hypothetical protein